MKRIKSLNYEQHNFRCLSFLGVVSDFLLVFERIVSYYVQYIIIMRTKQIPRKLSQSDQKADYSFKVTIAGETDVGKTKIVKRIVKGTYDQAKNATIGAQYSYKCVKVEDSLIRVEIWDTPSQLCHREPAKIYFQNSKGLILVYDVSNRNSFEKLAEWYKEISQIIEVRKIPVVIVGNKIDLEKNVSSQEGKKFADDRLLKFFEVSAKQNRHIDELLQGFTQEVYKSNLADQIMIKSRVRTGNVKLSQNKKKQKDTCC